jgi:predicted PurR-regulated permease PerM
METVSSGDFHIPPPPDGVADWPVVGDRLHAAWTQASHDLTGLARKFQPQIKQASMGMLGKVASVGVGLLLFMGALIVAGIIMAFGELGHRSSVRIARRIFGPDRGEQVTRLCVATIRAVAQGVVGIALIQMFLVGIGFVLMGVPGAGLLALGVLLLGIMQLPATILTVPVLIYMFATHDMTAGMIVLAIYVFVAGLVDNVLKPLLLGRGVEVPMPVVLIGALGGMVVGGILGLFIGPVMLSVGYVLFWQWVAQEEEPAAIAVDAVPATGTPAQPAA